MKCHFIKIGDGLLSAADEESRQYINKSRLGAGVAVEVTGARNIGFHRKLFALLRLAFDAWEPQVMWHGMPIQKDFERFRNDITILAGKYDVVVGIDGQPKPVARSISFNRMDGDEFSELYDKILDVVWDRILRHNHYRSRQEVDDVVAQLLAYS